MVKEIIEASTKELEDAKGLYLEAVEEEFKARGYDRHDTDRLIKIYKLRERLDAFPNLQMHYSIETTVDEMLSEDFFTRED